MRKKVSLISSVIYNRLDEATLWMDFNVSQDGFVVETLHAVKILENNILQIVKSSYTHLKKLHNIKFIICVMAIRLNKYGEY